MGRIIYICNADDTPTGGIKVIYRHAEALTRLGADACVMHPENLDFSCTWFEHQTPILRSRDLFETDFVIIPEIFAASVGSTCVEHHIRFAIFVQNGYATHSLKVEHTPEMFERVYEAADLVLSISEDTSRMVAFNYPRLDPARIVRMRYSISERFQAAADENQAPAVPTVCFMTRKLIDHVDRVNFALRRQLHRYPPIYSWQIEPIHNADENTVARILSRSRIFLSFSDFEGLPLPPLEAALAGNLVIGYTGQGGREYWHAPNFREIAQGDIRGFVTATVEAMRQIDTNQVTPEHLAPQIKTLAKQYSAAAEMENLRMLLDRIQACLAGAPRGVSLSAARA